MLSCSGYLSYHVGLGLTSTLTPTGRENCTIRDMSMQEKPLTLRASFQQAALAGIDTTAAGKQEKLIYSEKVLYLE